ncbi:hypothetical protein [Hyphomonas sp. GM-8P]|uniref:hypothetical protein n=1 Tax=Hyphomonas sp. GM-8P TaxID=1280945 RepID=UPI000DBF7213|nr:hypothetical protein [Hyphomonas sp. GM-8P]RAN39076.1 hypothetical protein HY26_17150 [Hyphomonas sp. GM-8P]
MPDKLIVSQAQLGQHFQNVQALLIEHTTANTKLEVNWGVMPVAAGLVGSDCEMVERQRGPKAFVARSKNITDNLSAWFGYREEWGAEASAGATNRFSFRAMSLTVHFGQIGALNKPQIFRAEWSGFTNWSGTSPSFQAPGAGHPHWQFDAIESFFSNHQVVDVDDLREALRSDETEEAVLEFEPNQANLSQLDELECATRLSRMHFASAAAWWRIGDQGQHAHAPSSIIELKAWLGRTLEYIGEELDRLA